MRPNRNDAGLWVMMVLSVTAVAGCSSPQMRTALQALGMVDDDPPPPVVIDLLCDHSRGSSCSQQNLASALNVVLPTAARRPGSTVRLWLQGASFGSTSLAGQRMVERPPEPGMRAIKAFEHRWTTASLEFFMRAAQPFLESDAPLRSPIGEAFGKIALAQVTPGARHQLVVLSDGRQFSELLGDWECSDLPAVDQFIHTLNSKGILAPESFRGACIIFAYFADGEIDGDRCEATMQRATRVRALWRAALVASAGASEVDFYPSMPEIR